MSRKLTLTALWVVFAVASVSVGFAAAGLVGDPFTDVGVAQGAALAGPGDAWTSDPGSTPSAAGSPSSGSTATAPPSSSNGGYDGGATAVRRGVTTHGGYVSGTCKDGLVKVGANPFVNWRVDSRTPGSVRAARVRLEPAKDANGERVEVTVTCQAGVPVFRTDYDDSSSGSGDGGSSGGG